MSSINSQPRPGTAFKKIMEEQAMLDGFMAMVKKKLEIDKRHLEDLIDLRKTWNPNWRKTGVWKLISPILTYFTEEIAHLTVAENDIRTRFNTNLKEVIPHEATEATFDPVDTPLREAYMACERHRKGATTPYWQKEIANAREDMKRLMRSESLDVSSRGLLPGADQRYRAAVYKQRQCVSSTVKWYDNELEGLIERHQQDAEDIKAFILGFCGSQGKLVADLSASCSAAQHSTHGFASILFIAPRHEETEQERIHLLLQKFDYYSFFDGRIVEPLFGVGPEQTLMLANRILDTMEAPRYPVTRDREGETDWVFDIEESTLTNPDLDAALRECSHSDLYLLLKVILLSDLSLFGVIRGDLSAYRNGGSPALDVVIATNCGVKVSRKRLHLAMRQIRPEHQKGVMSILSRLWRTFASTSSDITERTVTQLLCHDNVEAKAPIIRDIWRKWDFDAKCPLPDGVTREVASPWRLVWTKTGEPYVAAGSTALVAIHPLSVEPARESSR